MAGESPDPMEGAAVDVQQFFATLTDVPWLLTTLDLIGIFFFATSGALLAARKQFDLVGSMALSLLAGLGGGFTRDILLDRGLPASLENPVYLAPPVLVSLLVYVKLIHPNRLNPVSYTHLTLPTNREV